MRVLSIARHRADHGEGPVKITAQITLKTGREIYVCNPMPELATVMEAGEPFVAHSVVGMEPQQLIVNPPHVAAIEAVKE